MRRHPIIALAPNSWNGMWMNRQQLLSRLAARGWPVTYSNGPLHIWDRDTEHWKTASLFGRIKLFNDVKVDCPGRFPALWPKLPVWDSRVSKWHARWLKKSVNPSLPLIAYIFEPSYARYIDELAPQFIVYHPYDAFSTASSWSKAQADAERELVNRADLVITSSSGITNHLPIGTKPDAPRELPNAADFDAYEKSACLPCPVDLASIPHPRIGYTGAISLKVDLKLVANIAQKRANWHWILIGPLKRHTAGDDQNLARCLKLPNVHFLGEKEFHELPPYVGNMDVNVMCYRSDSGWWQAAYPLKTHEYLAAGKPVVSSYLERIQEFSGVIEFATGDDEWIAALERAIQDKNDGSTHRRQEIAKQNSWDTRVDLLETWLTEMIEAKEAKSKLPPHDT